jgi:hypothetical protein
MLRDCIAHLEDRVPFLYKHLGIPLSSEAAPGDDARIVGALKKGNTLEAIKVYRALYSSATVTVSLDEAGGGGNQAPSGPLKVSRSIHRFSFALLRQGLCLTPEVSRIKLAICYKMKTIKGQAVESGQQ